jgi:hypothetical protein
MTVTLKLSADVEKELIARARAKGVSLDEYIQEVVTREAAITQSAEPPPNVPNLSELLLNSPFSRADLDLQRTRDYPRVIDLE